MARWSKQTYCQVANILHFRLEHRSALPHATYEDAIRLLVSDFAVTFGKDNVRFDTARFLKACGVEE